MTRIFETTGKDIECLDAPQLTLLILRLMTLEAEKNGIFRSCVSGSLNITAVDGGEDAHVKWEGSPESTEWFPKRLILFQCKATDTNPSKCEAEILDSNNKIKQRVDEVLSSGGAYILSCTTSCSLKMEQERIDAFRQALSNAGKSYASTADIRVYHADKIAFWVNQHVSAITAVKNYIGSHLPAEMKTWVEWSGYTENSIPFVSDAALDGHIAGLRGLLAGNRKLARIIGLSGLGKTRLALETFRPPPRSIEDLAQCALSAGCVYMNASHAKDLPGILSGWVRTKLRGTVVIDNCDHALHKELSREVRHSDSQLNLLTLDYSVAEHPNDHPYIQIDRSSNEVIKGIITKACPGLRDSDRDRVVEFAQGFPQMAVLIAQAQLDREQDIGRLKDQDLVDRLVWQRASPDAEARKVIVVCSLFEHLGYAEDVTEQRVFAAEQICKINKDVFFRHSEEFIARRILDRRNRYVRVVPRPLAITLAAEWWRGCSPELAKDLFCSEMPAGMAEALCDQLANLQFVPRACEIVQVLCEKNGPFGQAEVLLSEQGSRLFRSLVEVNPAACVTALANVIGGLTHEQLRMVGPARRNLVWANEKLCFWEDTFPKAATIMLALAAAENETWGNNATNQFLQLFHICLSGTRAGPAARIAVVDEALTSDLAEKKSLAVRALGSVLDTGYFSRTGGVEKQGSRPASEDWYPKTNNDMFAYQNAALERIVKIACLSSELKSLAKKELGIRVRGLIAHGNLNSLEVAIREIGKASDGFWPEALHDIGKALQYEGERMHSSLRARIESWQKILTPTTLPEKLQLIVSIPDYEHLKGVNGHYIDIAAERAKALASELLTHERDLFDNLNSLITGEQRQGYTFGYALAQQSKAPERLIYRLLDLLRSSKGNPSVLCGLLAGLKDRNLHTQVLDQVSKESSLSIYLVELTRCSCPQISDLDRVIKATKDCRIRVSQLHAFSYNSVIDHLPVPDVIEFCNQVATFGVEGVACGFDILFMFCLHNKQRFEESHATFRRYLMTIGLLAEIGKNPTFRGHSWQETVCSLLQADPKDTELAVAVTRDIVAICNEDAFPYDVNYYVSEVLSLLFGSYFNDSWPLIGTALLADKWQAAHNLGFMIGGMGDKEKCGEVLSRAPLKILLNWCIANKPKGPRRIVRMIPILKKQPNGSYTWHEFARAMLDSFGDDAEFLRCVSASLNTFSWSGSVVPYYERQISMMQELETSPHAPAKEWAKKEIEYLKEQIASERKKEEEQDLGM